MLRSPSGIPLSGHRSHGRRRIPRGGNTPIPCRVASACDKISFEVDIGRGIGEMRYRRHMICNVHEREISATRGEVAALINSLGSKNDRLWPRGEWPAMRLDGPLRVGASGGHGPVRYFVTQYEPGERVEFQFTSPSGFNGFHSFTATSLTGKSVLLRHELSMSPSGMSILTWPIFFRPLHNALIEECLDRGEIECGSSPVMVRRRTIWTKLLRATHTGTRGFSPAEKKNHDG